MSVTEGGGPLLEALIAVVALGINSTTRVDFVRYLTESLQTARVKALLSYIPAHCLVPSPVVPEIPLMYVTARLTTTTIDL